MVPGKHLSRYLGSVGVALALAFASPAAHAAKPNLTLARAAMQRHAPTAGHVELGLYGGLMVPAYAHGFYSTHWRPLRPELGSVGVRIGRYMLPWFGGEVEAGALPGRTADGQRFTGLALRAHTVFQLPYRIAPFVLAGVGVLAVRSPVKVLGSDYDPAGHVGAGLKFHALRWLALRAEWRGTITPGRDGAGGQLVLHNEVMFGVSFLFGGAPRR